MNIALEAGYRHIDTATSYENEKVIGDVLKNWFDSKKLKRSDIFIVTKVILTIIHYIHIYNFVNVLKYFYVFNNHKK